MVTVRSTLSKARHQYFTFMTASAASNLTAYLNDRLAHGEPRDCTGARRWWRRMSHPQDEPGARNRDKEFLITSQVSHLVRQDVQAEVHVEAAYMLRVYF